VTTEAIEQPFKKYLKYSGIFHVAVFLFFMVQFYFAPDTEDDIVAMKVDLVALPDKIDDKPLPQTAKPEKKQEEKSVPEPVKPKAAPKEEAINLDKSKSKQKDALEKLKQLEALNKLEKEAKEESKPKPQFKGNVLSPGTELTGISKIQEQTYRGNLKRHVNSFWSLPQYLRDRGYQSLVNIKVDAQGNIIKAELVKSSGSQAFDEMVMAAVHKSSPVPAPPEKFVRISEIDGYLLSFEQ
jgi:colicin import membrane protein